MSSNLIRDPVHNLIRFDFGQTDRLLLKLINAKEFQRLRRVCQLGVTPLVFPGANHTRFAHSIGVLHVARRFLDHLERLPNVEISPEQRRIVLVAALLHDVGHGPFSHAFESITREDHEARTAEIIGSERTEVNQLLREVHADLPNQVASIFDESPGESEGSWEPVPSFLTQVVSSQMDADRFDYLLRDAYSTGTTYGAFDLDWILEHLIFDEAHERLVLTNKALHDAEAYVFARYRMYRNVYFHKATRAAEVMLRLAFQRFQELIGEDNGLANYQLERCPAALLRAFGVDPGGEAVKKKMSLEDYLLLDDHTVTEFFKVAQSSSDQTLSDLAAGLLHRRLYKSMDVTGVEASKVRNFCVGVNEIVTRRVPQPAYGFASDTPSDMPYKPYDPDSSNPATMIYIAPGFGDPQELSTLSESVRTLQKRWVMTRYYFPEQIRDEIQTVADETLR